MGFLEAGAPLSWEASARYRDVVKRRGVREFIQLYKQFRADVFPKSTLSWGDEVEYCLLNLDVQNKVARLYLGAEGVLGELKTRENLAASEQLSHQSSDTCANALLKTAHDPLLAATALQATAAFTAQARASAAPTAASTLPGKADAAAVHLEVASTATGDSKEAAALADTPTAAPRWPWQMSNWHPEYGAHMIEAIPGRVYPLQVDSILDLLPSMQVRRKKVQAVLPPGCYVASMGSFPTMGAPESRVRPCCCHMRFSPTFCCLQAPPRKDTPGKGGAIGDCATGESAAREKNRSIQTHGAVAPDHPAIAHLRPAVDVTAASAVSAVTDTAPGARSRGTASVAGEELRGGVAAGAVVSAAILGAEGPRPTIAASSPAAAYPSSPAKPDQERGKVDMSVFRATSKLQSHTLSDRELFHAVENFVSSKQVKSQRGVVAEAEEKRAILGTQREEEPLVAEKAALEGEEETVERDERPTEDCGAAADGGQAVNNWHFTQATNMRPAGGTERRTPAAVAEEVCSCPCLALVGVTAHTGDFASPSAAPDPIKSRSRSLFVGDTLINPHPRFGTLTANIRERRGKKVEILIPLFVDENTAFTCRLKNLARNLEPHSPPAAPRACGCASTSHLAADEIAVMNQGAAGGRAGAGSVCAAGAAGGKTGAAGTRAEAAVPGQGGAAEAGANRPATADCAGKAPRVAGGSNVENIPRCVEEACSKEEYYRQLMLEGKILHDGKFIYMDAMGFGMGMHCVQATFGCPSMRDARYLYDQLAVLAPLWLSLSAATPFMRGLLAAVDSRWDVISACVDCRTDAEKSRLPKSRYGTVSLYISDEAPLTDHLSFYNDVPAPVNEPAFAALVENGVDEILARHMAFLFVRDPLVIFKDKLLAHKPLRLKTTAPVCGVSRTASDTGSGSAASAAPRSSATATTSSGPTTTSVASTAVVAVSATPTDTVTADTTSCILSHPSSLPSTAALRTACSGNRSASSVRLPLQQQGERAEQEEQLARTHHKEDAGEDDTAVVAEAAAAWGIDDGTVYTETQDFENIQSTNWNSVRFKPPAAFKPWSVSGTPPGPSGAYKSGHSSPSKRNSESNSMRTTDGQRSNSRRRRCGSGSRSTRTNQHMDVYRPSSAGGSGKVREEIGGGLDRFEKAGIRKRNESNSVSTIVPAPFLDIADCTTAGLSGGNSGLPAAPPARGRGDAGAAAAGEGESRRQCSCVQKLTAQAKGEKEATAAFSQRKLPLTPVEDAFSSLSSLYRSSHSSVPPSATSSSAAAATRECCAVPWRVEFRTPDVQLTDFENVACLSLVSVLVQVILEERLDLYLPMSLNDENTRRAVECNSILRQKFWFRNDVRHGTADRSFGEFSLHQILFGGSASRNSDASPLQILRDPSSSTRLPFACRSPFSPAAVDPTFRSSFCRWPFVPPASAFTCSGAVHLQTPQFSPCSPVSSLCTPTVAIPSAKPHSAIPSPFSGAAAHLPPLLSPEASPGALPRGSPPLLHFQNVESGDEYSLSAPAPRAAAPGRLDFSPATTLISPYAQSSRPAASASAAFRLCSSAPSRVAAGDVTGGTHTTATEASLSVASSSPRALFPPSLSPSVSPFVGLVPLCLRYIEKEVVAGHCSREAAAQYLEYFDFLRHRTEGLVPTDASFLRACLAVHPAYNQDSVVPAQACFDLCQLAVKVGHGEFQVPELLGPFAGRAGMRVSADCCGFDNGVPVVTSSFLSQFVSDALKEMLRGYVIEAPNGCWQEEKQPLFACTRWGPRDVKDRAGVGSQRSYARQDTRTAAAVATTEMQRVAQKGDTVAYLGGQEGVDQEPDPTRAAASATEREVLKEQKAADETAYRVIHRNEDTATEDGARLHSDIATVRRGKDGTPAGVQISLGNGPASDCVLPRRAAAACSKATITTVEVTDNIHEFPRESAGNGVSYGARAEAGQMLQNETEIGRVRSTSVGCTGFSATSFQDGKVPQDNESNNSNTLIDKKGNSASEAESRPKGISRGEEELRKDPEQKAEQGTEPVFRDESASTAPWKGSVTTEKKVHHPVRLDVGSYGVLQEKHTIRNMPSLTTAAPAGTSGPAGDDDVPWNGSRSAAALHGTCRAAQLQEGIEGALSCKLAAPAQRRAPPSVALVSSSFAGEAGGSGPRTFFREEIADRRISFALSGKAAASLCNADTVSMLRSYMSDPLCRSTTEAGSCAPAVPAAAGAGRERSCNMYSGWPECASVGVTNEEATGLWLFLTSGLQYSWRCDDSGSTSCSSTDDDRESADEVSDAEINGEQRTNCNCTWIYVTVAPCLKTTVRVAGAP